MKFTYLSLLKDTLSRPKIDNYFNGTLLEKIWICWVTWSIMITLAFFAGIINTFFIASEISGNNQLSDFIFNENIWFIIFVVSFLGPILEELAFRAFLTANKFWLSVGFGFGLIYTLRALENVWEILFQETLINFGLWSTWVGSLTFGVLMSVAVYYVFSIFKIFPKLQSTTQKYSRVIFYISAILFALIHSFNFLGVENYWYLTPLLTLPQLFSGIGLAFLRIKIGISASIFIHILNNSVAILPLLFIRLFIPDILTLENGTQDLTSAQTIALLVVGAYLLILAWSVLTTLIIIIYRHTMFMPRIKDSI